LRTGKINPSELKIVGQKVYSPIFAKTKSMEVKKKSTGLYWLLFFASTIALIAAIALHWPWLTLIIPFVTTFFVLAMDLI
jgi:hypothetical protein